jgi:SAM-dependent methyltransferase
MNRAQKFWDKQAKRFEGGQKRFGEASRQLISATKEFLDTNDNVLDFGCASGGKTLELAGSAGHIHGLDFSAEMISEAVRNSGLANAGNVSFAHGTIFSDELGKGSFDKIIAFSIIHLLEESEPVVQRINELLKPGGLLISETACFREKMNMKTRFEFSIFRFMRRLGIFPLHLNIFKVSDVEELLQRHDFNIRESRRFFFNGMTISFIVAEKR